ncbi:YggS family pyridoxal phosphate-dependent enzyme [Aquitalea sp. LB_tupeE]|uniref:YggS family pyridoxal phosphate-dependent enzyme n=1 Tax=Aquitalea sp. LB_tupeE TaxID=2748078 RepID=UPI0015B9F242|nr:YggS family pyridoxal phosphate-dependent enzyme [Aquitalea sp. LB_tupeE]NWK77722.1 YggS family pyridoxal phosphate-dependent enzyme [Aquitalea sp. LB_tupeE]
MSDSIAQAIASVTARIRAAEAAAGRTAGSVRLLAVSKTFPASAVVDAYAAGQRAFGENYVQELQTKAAELTDLDIEWHFIGPLQSNKTRIVAQTAHWVHSIERLKIAQRLSEQRPSSLPPLQVCIQVNVSGEQSKSGCQPHEARALARAVAALPGLQLRGLMCIPEATDNAQTLSAQFALLARVQDELQQDGLKLDTVSMGMSADMAQAIAAGSTMVRVGTAIFGARHYPQ